MVPVWIGKLIGICLYHISEFVVKGILFRVSQSGYYSILVIVSLVVRNVYSLSAGQADCVGLYLSPEEMQ